MIRDRTTPCFTTSTSAHKVLSRTYGGAFSPNLTQLELPVLHEDYNLTDGHVHFAWSPSEQRVIANLPEMFTHISRQQQLALESDFIDVLYELAGQSVNPDKTRFLLCTSASQAVEIVANYLRLNKSSVSLIEPCFDNLADIFKRHKIPLQPFPDNILVHTDLVVFLDHLDTSAIVLVSPNNPTGCSLTPQSFEALVEFCDKKRKLLVLDSSFRFYNPIPGWDQYELLNRSNIDYIVIEDTGKTWATHELKIGLLAVSSRLFGPLFKIHSDLILHVSPFVLKLLTEFIRLSIQDSLLYQRQIVMKNRQTLYKALSSTLFEPTEAPFMSVSWLRILSGETSQRIAKHLANWGVFVLPGNNFFWSKPQQGDRFIRVSLARETATFDRAVSSLREACRHLYDANSDRNLRPVE